MLNYEKWRGGKERAFDQDADLRFRIMHDVPIFNRPFRQVAQAYVDLQKERWLAGEITKHRWEAVDSVVNVQINQIGPDRWTGYETPAERYRQVVASIG